MQAGAMAANPGRQSIDNMIGRAVKANGSGRSFTAREARTSAATESIQATSGAATPMGNPGRELKFMRFSLSFDAKSAELFILVRDPSSGKVIFRSPNVARPSPVDEAADKQEAELKAALSGEGQKTAEPASDGGDMAAVLAAMASNSNAPAGSSSTSQASNRTATAGGEAGARGQGVNVTA